MKEKKLVSWRERKVNDHYNFSSSGYTGLSEEGKGTMGAEEASAHVREKEKREGRPGFWMHELQSWDSTWAREKGEKEEGRGC